MRHHGIGMTMIVGLGAVSAAWAAGPQGVNLAELEGWDIVVADEAIPSEVYAAQELQGTLKEATGVELPIVDKTDRPDRHVYVGPSRALEASPIGFKTDELGPEDLRIVIRGRNIAIAGGRTRGTLYGVYVFLEDYLGVRFLTTDHTYVPKVGLYRVVGPVDRSYRPPLTMRWSYYGEINRDAVFAARRRINTVGGDPKLGGKSGQQLINHTFLSLIPSQKYGKEHPEYYALRDGKRLAQVDNDAFGTEPCLTNPDVLRIVTERVLAQLAEHPEWENVSVSQNDNPLNCQCPNCKAIDDREGTPMGTLLTFVNAVADAVAEKYPNVKVGTLSYWYTRKPPKTIKPRPNVQIQLCSIECCVIHPINDPKCPLNVEFCRDMNEWGKLTDQIFIWNYNTNFSNYLLPCPNLRVIEPNIRYFVANGAKGIFMQAAGNAQGAELSDLRNYIISGLLWDPARSGERLMDEFIDLHYGRAGVPIRRFIELTHDNAEAKGIHRNCFGQAGDYALDADIAKAGLAAFDEAMSLADSEQVRQRVEKASICALRLAIDPVYHIKKEDLKPELAAQMRPLVKRFFELCGKYKVDRGSEGESINGVQERLRAVFGVPESGSF